MGKTTGFMEIARQDRKVEAIGSRVKHFNEFVISFTEDELKAQGARCMDCGIPFCQAGCPIHNIIPDWNDLVYRAQWKEASEVLHSTNNFPDFTGRVCPAPCEAACTLNIDDQPVTIKSIEQSIVERAWQENWIEPEPVRHRTGKYVTVVGSGPCGLACAQQLARAGHSVHLYEKNDRSGGLLRYGIPDFKLEKIVIDRRMAQMKAEGVKFHSGVNIGEDVSMEYLITSFDAIVLAAGSEKPRDMPIEGRKLNGIHFAMEFLSANTQRVQGHEVSDAVFISAKDKQVVVIGGGDTGSDCVGTSIRQGAKSVTQIEVLSEPPEKEDKGLVWPSWPHKKRTSSSQEEGCERIWDVKTTQFGADDSGNVRNLKYNKVSWDFSMNPPQMQDVPESQCVIEADLVLLAMGFAHPRHEGLLEKICVEKDQKGNVRADTEGQYAYQTNVDKVFAAGDMRRGQSLVVWAIREGRQCARAVDAFLQGRSELAD